MLLYHPPERSVLRFITGFWQRHAEWGKVVASISNSGGAWSPWGSSPVIRRLRKQNSSMGRENFRHFYQVNRRLFWNRCREGASFIPEIPPLTLLNSLALH